MTTTFDEALKDLVTGLWWLTLLRGLLAVLVGLYALFNPAGTVIILISILAVYVLVDGIFMSIAALMGRDQEGWGWVLLRGVLGILAGGLALWGGVLGIALFTTLVLVYLIGIQAIFSGLIDIFTAIRVRKDIDNEWSIILAGLLHIIFGLLLIANPLLAGRTLVQITGSLGIIVGIVMILFAFRLRNTAKDIGNVISEA